MTKAKPGSVVVGIDGSAHRLIGERARQVLTAVVLAYVGTLWLGAFHHLTGEHAHSSLPSALDVLRRGSAVLPAVLAVLVGVMSLCEPNLRGRRRGGSGVEGARWTVGVAASAAGAALVLGAVVPVESVASRAGCRIAQRPRRVVPDKQRSNR